MFLSVSWILISYSKPGGRSFNKRSQMYTAKFSVVLNSKIHIILFYRTTEVDMKTISLLLTEIRSQTWPHFQRMAPPYPGFCDQVVSWQLPEVRRWAQRGFSTVRRGFSEHILHKYHQQYITNKKLLKYQSN